MRSFARRDAAQKNGFDFKHDYPLIVASFANAYSLRIRAPGTRIPWPEFTALLAGLPPDTPLPRMVSIRLASDKEAELFGKPARQARNDWQLWLTELNPAAEKNMAESLERLLRSACAAGSPLTNKST